MGDRVSIQFKNGNDKSVVMYSHWGGMNFVETARSYIKELNTEVPKGNTMPLQRREVDVVIIDFIHWLFKDEHKHIMSSYRIHPDATHGDNSDNGHHIIEV